MSRCSVCRRPCVISDGSCRLVARQQHPLTCKLRVCLGWVQVVSHSESRSGAARNSLEQTSLDLLWERDNHLALNSALAAVKSAARAQQLAQLPALAQRPDSVPQPLVHSWVPPATQQLSSFQNWLQKEQAKISSYTGPKDPLAPAARQPTSSVTHDFWQAAEIRTALALPPAGVGNQRPECSAKSSG